MSQKRRIRKKPEASAKLAVTEKTAIAEPKLLTAPSAKSSHRLHFRRCHLCSGVTEQESEPVDRCMHCGKPMAPFYFFNDLEVLPISDLELRDQTEMLLGIRRPLRGFTAQW